MNLGTIYLDTGDLRKARQMTEEALQEITPTQDARGMVYALEDLGAVLLAMGDASGGTRHFGEGRQLALSHALPALVCESTSGLAACAIMQGQLDEAREHAHEAWDYLRENDWTGMGNPGKVYRYCAETFDALGDAENAGDVIETAHAELIRIADWKNVPVWRQAFLENVPDHQALMEMWERRHP